MNEPWHGGTSRGQQAEGGVQLAQGLRDQVELWGSQGPLLLTPAPYGLPS